MLCPGIRSKRKTIHRKSGRKTLEKRCVCLILYTEKRKSIRWQDNPPFSPSETYLVTDHSESNARGTPPLSTHAALISADSSKKTPLTGKVLPPAAKFVRTANFQKKISSQSFFFSVLPKFIQQFCIGLFPVHVSFCEG